MQEKIKIKPIYVALGADVINYSIIIIGYDSNKEQLQAKIKDRLNEEECRDITYTKIFNISFNDNLGYELMQWLRSTGTPSTKIKEDVISILKAVIDIDSP